jgi:hypothetical protein
MRLLRGSVRTFAHWAKVGRIIGRMTAESIWPSRNPGIGAPFA